MYGGYVFIKVALDDAPAVFLADDTFFVLGAEVLLTPVCHDRKGLWPRKESRRRLEGTGMCPCRLTRL